MAARSLRGRPGRAPRWEAAAAEVISCAWPRAARRARCGQSGRGAAAGAGAGLCAELPGTFLWSHLGPPRPPRPLLPGSGDPAASGDPAGAAAGAEARVVAGVAAGLPAAHSGERPRGSGRAGRAGGGVCRPEWAFGPGADWADSSRRGGRLRSRCLPTWERRDRRRPPGAPGHPHWEVVTSLPAVGRSCHLGPA